MSDYGLLGTPLRRFRCLLFGHRYPYEGICRRCGKNKFR
jgi:hypothetical protein